MTQSEPQLTLQAMINKGPEWLDTYLRQFEEGKPLPPNYSMIGIEAGALSRARYEKSLEWAGIAVRAADMHALESGGQYRASALRKAMALRAWFISRMGSESGHPILDKDIILRWFKTETEFSMEATKEKSARWKNTKVATLTRNELIKLKNIKGRIDVLRVLADCGELPEDPDLNEWLEIRDQIP